MKNYTKQITAFAVLSLFAYSANAQSAIYTGNWVDADYNNNILSGLTITPQASVDPAFIVPVAAEELNIVATTSEIDPETGVITTTIVNQLTKWTGTDTTVSPGDSVVIDNSGITLNQVTTRTDSLELFVRVTEVSINDGLGNVDSITSEWTAVAYTSDDTNEFILDEFDNEIPNPDFGVEIPDTEFTSALSQQDAYNKIADSLQASTAAENILEDALTEGEPTSTGGNLFVGGQLLIAAEILGQQTMITVGEVIVDLAETIGVLGGDELATEADTLIGAINEVDAAIATEVADRTALIRRDADDNIRIGGNTLIYNDTTDTISTTSGVLTLDADVEITGDLNIAGLTGDVASAINTNAADIVTGDATTLASANTYTDGEVATEAGLRIAGDATTLASANTYTDGEVATEAGLRIAGDATTLASANSYTDDEVAAEALTRGNADFALGSRIDNNTSAIANNSSRIASNKKDIEQNTRGIAMVAALQHTTVLPGMKNAFDLSAAHFEGETGMALNYARRLSENVQVNFGAASTTDFDESVIKAGIGVQW